MFCVTDKSSVERRLRFLHDLGFVQINRWRHRRIGDYCLLTDWLQDSVWCLINRCNTFFHQVSSLWIIILWQLNILLATSCSLYVCIVFTCIGRNVMVPVTLGIGEVLVCIIVLCITSINNWSIPVNVPRLLLLDWLVACHQCIVIIITVLYS